jgi:hypothetical protein
MSVIRAAQNRRIGTAPVTLNLHAPTFISFDYTWSPADGRLNFSKNYEVGLRTRENEWDHMASS